MAKISFHGAAREVTGSCIRIESAFPFGSSRSVGILIDCGMFQGPEKSPMLNRAPFDFDPREIHILFITHAHIDHIGRIPRLVKDGFSGVIYSTAPTRDLARLLLEDALAVHEHDRQNEHLYEEEDIEKTFSLWKTEDYGVWHEIAGLEPFSEHRVSDSSAGSVRFRLRNIGHILGSAAIEIALEEKRILATGDIGNVPSSLLPPPDEFDGIDYLIVESTYGSRMHEAPEERVVKLERAVEDVVFRKGTLLVPAFATERTQELLHHINELLQLKRIPDVPVFIDAPLAVRITEVFERYPQFYKPEIRELFTRHPHLFKFKRLRIASTVEESKAINEVPPPKVVITGSGMMAGGRVLHHALRYLPDPSSILLITGYQSSGSLGRKLIEGEKNVRILREEVRVEAEIRKINGFSAHADSAQLFSFVEKLKPGLKRAFVVHGEEAQAIPFMTAIKDRLGLDAAAPETGETFEI